MIPRSFSKKENSQGKQERSFKEQDHRQTNKLEAVHKPHRNKAVVSMEALEVRTWSNSGIMIPINLVLLMIPMSPRTNLQLQQLNQKKKQLNQSINHNLKRREIMRKRALLRVLNQTPHQMMRIRRRKRRIRKMLGEVSINLKRQRELFKGVLHSP